MLRSATHTHTAGQRHAVNRLDAIPNWRTRQLFVSLKLPDVKTRPWPGCDGEPSSRTAQAQSERTQAIAIMP
jgi:hypothetical protein